MDNSSPRQNFNPNTLGDDLKRESKSKWLESTASRQLCKALKTAGFTYSRVETGSTHRGFPDIVCGHPELEAVLFIELKAGANKVEPAQIHFLTEWWAIPSALTLVVRAETPKRWTVEFPHIEDIDDKGFEGVGTVYKSATDIINNFLIPNMSLTWAYASTYSNEDGDDEKVPTLEGSSYCEGTN